MFPRTNTCFGQKKIGAAPLEGMYGIFRKAFNRAFQTCRVMGGRPRPHKKYARTNVRRVRVPGQYFQFFSTDFGPFGLDFGPVGVREVGARG